MEREIMRGPGRMEHVSINGTDGYVDLDAQVDLAHGCVIVVDVVADVAADVAVDVGVDVAADAAGDAAADAAADAAGDAAADAAGDAAGDAAADAAADVAAEPGVSSTTYGALKTLGLLLGGALLGQVVAEVTNVVKSVISSSSSSSPPTSADYWSALYTQMIASYPCNTGYATACPTNVRNEQKAMVAAFPVSIAQQDPSAATQAQTFEQSWPGSAQQSLKQTLTQMSATTGIPGLVQYMESYTYPGVSGGALVIATANILVEVADFVYTD